LAEKETRKAGKPGFLLTVVVNQLVRRESEKREGGGDSGTPSYPTPPIRLHKGENSKTNAVRRRRWWGEGTRRGEGGAWSMHCNWLELHSMKKSKGGSHVKNDKRVSELGWEPCKDLKRGEEEETGGGGGGSSGRLYTSNREEKGKKGVEGLTDTVFLGLSVRAEVKGRWEEKEKEWIFSSSFLQVQKHNQNWCLEYSGKSKREKK